MARRDADGQPVVRAFRYHDSLIKSLDSLYGLCSGLIADGHLVDREILVLDSWLKEAESISEDWPANVIVQRVRSVLVDGVITDEERADLLETLSSMIGGNLEEHGAPSGLATRLPVESVNKVEFQDRAFCFTGKFIFGSRAKCEKAITDRGGVAASSITHGLDYLVIGTLASRDWKHTSHGTKIAKAIEYKEAGRPISIVAEELWVTFIT